MLFNARPRVSMRLLGGAMMALLPISAFAAEPEDLNAAMLSKMDWPDGRPFFGWGASHKKAVEVWNESAGRSYTELPSPPSPDRSRIVHRSISEPRPVPAAALAVLKSATPETGWFEYWVKTRVEPINGASAKRMYSTADRRLVRCEPALMVGAAKLHFASLDATGEPYDTTANYGKAERIPAATIGMNEQLRHEYRTICGPVLAAAYGADQVDARVQANLAPPKPTGLVSSLTPEQQLKLIADMRALLKLPPAEPADRAASGAVAADMPASAASSVEAVAAPPAEALTATGSKSAPTGTAEASAPPSNAAPAEPLPLGSAKARLRLFAQNGTAVSLTNEASCVAPGGMGEASSNLLKNLASAMHVASNETLGMPESTTTRRLSERSGVASKAYFMERAITAEMPVSVNFTFAANNQTCPSVAVSFVPEAGGDYESKLDVGYGYCFVSVGRITPSGAVVPVRVTSAPACPPEK